MEVMEGFKMTEVGVIPMDWEISTFEEVADKSKKWSITGGPFGSNLKASDYTDLGIQIIQLQNIGDGEFIDDNKIYTSKEKANELLSANIYPGEIILSKMGYPVARACFIPNKAERFVMASDGIRLVVNTKEYDKKFVHDYINSKYFRKRAEEASTGSTRQRIGIPDLKNLKFIKPSLKEQKVISTALSDMDALIQSLDQLIAKKRAIKQGAMQTLLTPPSDGGKRLAGFSGEWEERTTIGDLVTFVGGSQPPRDTFIFSSKPDYIRLLQIRDYKTEKYRTFIPKELARRYCDKNNIMIGRYGPPIFQILEGLEGAYNVALIKAIPSSKIDKEYLRYFLKQKKLFEFVEKLSQRSSGQTGVDLRELKNYLLPLPPTKEEQKAIANILSDIDDEIQSLKAKKAKYQSIKQGMMQQLLTGKIRLI